MKCNPYSRLILSCCLILVGLIGCNSPQSKTDNPENHITIMSYNIRYDNPGDGDNTWGNRKEDVVSLIRRHGPDFLGIQEGLHHQVAYINNQISNFKFIGKGRDDGKTKGEYTALFYDSTKYSLVKHETFWLSENPDTVSVGWDASMERICTYGLFKSRNSGKVLHVFNAHFDHIGPEARLNSAKTILARITDRNISKERIVVMGDFNAEPKSDPITTFSSVLDDGQAITKDKFEGSIGTFSNFDPMFNPERRIDYIFTKNLSVSNYEHIDDKRPNGLCVSDHLPILAKIK